MKLRHLVPFSASLLLLATASLATNGVVNLSHYDEGAPDFAAMRRSGIVGIIHEATYPPQTGDPRYIERQDQANRAGLLWGAYHFANGSNPIRQADAFVDFVRAQALPGPRSTGVLMVLDFEQNTHYPGGTMTVPAAIEFIQRVKERTGKYPGIYSNENRVRAVLNHPSISSEERRRLSQTWLWVANYHHQPQFTAPWSKWTLWQYTGDGICELPRNRYPMAIANVRQAERNLFQGSENELRHFWRDNAWVPE